MTLIPPSDEVIDAARSLGIDVAVLSVEEASLIREQVINKIAPGGRGATWLWDGHLTESVSVQDAAGWQKMDSFLQGQAFIMFFNPGDDRTMIAVPPGSEVGPVLGQCRWFEFYITDRKARYILCHNHHDFLIAAGTAMQWLAGLEGSQTERRE